MKPVVHPFHYYFGAIFMAPSIFPLWTKEDPLTKVSMLVPYALACIIAGLLLGSVNAALSSFLLLLFSICILSIPITMLMEVKRGFLVDFSDNFLDTILPFHCFLIAYKVIYTAVGIIAGLTGTWTIELSNCMLALSSSMAIAYSTQMGVSKYNENHWGLTPFFAIIAFGSFYWVLT